MKRATLLAIPLALATLGCQTLDAGDDVPARIVNPDAASRAALQEAVNTAFGTDVTLAETALTDSSVLTIERTPPASMDSPKPMGRNMETPFRMRLYLNGSDCILVDERDSSRYRLVNTSCEAE